MPALAFDGDRLLLVAGAAYGDLNADALQVSGTLLHTGAGCCSGRQQALGVPGVVTQVAAVVA
jgi:hypothetical protein